MPEEAGDGPDLSGAWSGLYSFPKGPPPVFFDADLASSGDWITGTTSETVMIGGHKRILGSTLSGRRSGHEVTWLKTYDDAPVEYDAVHYEGRINADASEIEGRWVIAGNWSGTFLMIRGGRGKARRARDVAVSV
jgi:hypothetical protein